MKKRLRTGESRSLSNQKKKISPETKKLLLLTLLCTALLFGFYMFAQYQIGGLFSFVVFCIYAFLCTAFVLAYIIYNRGFSRKNLTFDRLPDYMTFAEKEEYIEDGKRRISQSRWLLVVIFPLMFSLFVDAVMLFTLPAFSSLFFTAK